MMNKRVLTVNSKIQQNLLSGNGVFTDCLFLTSMWVLAILLVNFTGDFPLNDDWSYGIAVKRMVEEGTYNPTPWTSMSLITQVWLGALFSWIFGFSFEIIRLSTLFLSLLTLFSVYCIIRQLNQPRFVALLGSVAIAFNPVYFQLSFTFMTDIPFLAFTAISLVFFVKYLKEESKVDLIIGSFFICAAILCRQNGLFVPIAFGLTLLYKNRFRAHSWIPAITPGVLGLGALLVYQSWMKQTGTIPELYGKQVQDLLDILLSPGQWPVVLAKSGLVGFMYLGLFLLPVFIMMLASETTTPQNAWVKKWVKRAVGPLSLLLGLVVFFAGKIMPLGGNILHKAGLGPLTLEDTYLLQLPNIQVLPEVFWLVVTALSILGAAIFLVYLASLFRFVVKDIFHQERSFNHYVILFFLFGTLIYCFPIIFLGFYDRYLLVPLVLLTFVFLAFSDKIYLSKPKIFKANIALLSAFMLFSIAGTHDYLSWNRARWQGLQQLVEQENVPYAKINGGFEFNGMALFTDEANRYKRSDVWWEENDDVYMFSFGRVPGYQVLRSYRYSRWLPPMEGEVLLLKRTSE